MLSNPCGVWRGEACARTRTARAPRHARTGRPHIPHVPRAAPPWRAIAQAGSRAWLTVQVLAPHVRVPQAAARASGRRAACAARACVHTTGPQRLQPVSQRNLHHKLVRCVNPPCVGSCATRRCVMAACACARVYVCVRACERRSTGHGTTPPPCHPTCHTPHATHRMPHTAGGLAWLTVQVLVPHVRVPPPAGRASCRLAACAALAYCAVHTTASQPLQPVSQRSLRHKLVRCFNQLCVGSGAPRRRVRAACARAWGGVRA